MSPALPPIIVSSHDLRRIEALLASPLAAGSPVAAQLEAELSRAEVRAPAAMPGDVVTMNSEVECVDDATGIERRLRLVYPNDADVEAGRVSVLAPVGAALLGLSAGQSIDWPLPGGKTSRLRVQRVVDQPPAAALPE